MTSVYPRWRGEHNLPGEVTRGIFGLSPLARGTPSPRSGDAHAERFIPAGAGNTLTGHLFSTSQPVYPRWRGEHTVSTGNYPILVGLSPLARGTPGLPSHLLLTSRFIPAGAGNTDFISFYLYLFPVYPRWRGEHFQTNRGRGRFNGLSPLARGTRASARNGGVEVRFIPAGAGNTFASRLLATVPSVYPRWRGEHPVR